MQPIRWSRGFWVIWQLKRRAIKRVKGEIMSHKEILVQLSKICKLELDSVIENFSSPFPQTPFIFGGKTSSTKYWSN